MSGRRKRTGWISILTLELASLVVIVAVASPDHAVHLFELIMRPSSRVSEQGGEPSSRPATTLPGVDQRAAVQKYGHLDRAMGRAHKMLMPQSEVLRHQAGLSELAVSQLPRPQWTDRGGNTGREEPHHALQGRSANRFPAALGGLPGPGWAY